MSAPQPPSPDHVKRLHLTAIEGEGYPHSLDRQQRTIEFLQAAVKAGGEAILRDTYVQEVAARMAMRLGVTQDRVLAIVRLTSHQEVRRALKSKYVEPRARLDKERIYPRTGWLGAYLEHCILSEQPLGWHFWCGLAVLGAACRRNLYMDLGFGEVLYPNHYILLVGESGLGKNQAINRAAALIRRANQFDELKRASLERNDDLRAIVINEVTAASMAESLKIGPVEIPGTKCMVERTQSVGVLVNAEAANLLGKARREHAELLLTFLTDFYDGDPKDASTITRGDRSLGPGALTLMLGSTAEWLGTSVTQAVVSGGFTGRCTFVHRTERDRVKYREIPHDYVPDPVQANELARLLLPWLLATPIEVVMEPDAQGWWEEWYVQHRDTVTPSAALEGWWHRKPVHVAKLAMLLVASELCSPTLDLARVKSLPLSLKVLQKAERLVSAEGDRIPKVLEHIDRAPEVPLQNYVMEKIRALATAPKVLERGYMTHTDIFFETRWRVGTGTKLRAIMESLVEAKLVSKVPHNVRAPRDGAAYILET